MLRTAGLAFLLLGVLWTAGVASTETGFSLSGGGTLDVVGTGTMWLACAALCAVLWVVDRRAALMTVATVAAFVSVGVLLFAAGQNPTSSFIAFGAAAGGVAVTATAVLVRGERAAARLPNPLRDAAAQVFEEQPLLEVAGVQYLAELQPRAVPPAVHVRVVFQNCHDTPAVARVRLEEDVVGQPSIVLPEIASVAIGSEGWSVLDWVCPVRPGHRGEGWFHVSVNVGRDRGGRRSRPWRARTGPAGLKATQLLRGVLSRGKQYVPQAVPLPEADGARTSVDRRTREVLESELAAVVGDSGSE